MIKKTPRNLIRKRRHERVRNHIHGTAERPRLCVYRSLSHIYAQVVDDVAGKTIVAASSRDKELAAKLDFGGNVEAAKAVGELIAKRAQAEGVETVVFDRGGYVYHGRVAALAEAARAAGLVF